MFLKEVTYAYQGVLIYKMLVNSYGHFESQKKHIRHHKINPRGFWQYIAILWSKTISLCKKLNVIYNIMYLYYL